MRPSLIFVLTLTLSLSQMQAQDKPPMPFPWPEGARAAVCLTYDDGLDCHLDVAMPALEKYGLKGTFYASGFSSSLFTRMDEWRDWASKGYEIGNHTLFHPCDGYHCGVYVSQRGRGLSECILRGPRAIAGVPVAERGKSLDRYLPECDGVCERAILLITWFQHYISIIPDLRQ
jgi:hypothetical protein